ncbi:MAG: hypothetical protein H7840_06460 [Alphaproteobacteria bacterium]
MTMTVRSVKSLTALLLAAALTLSTALAAPLPSEDEVDLIDDRPSAIATALGVTGEALTFVADQASELLSRLTPPSPTSLSRAASAEDEQELMSLLGYAGYKLKEIDSQVGIIPTIAFKFALVRELSEADWDFLAYRLEASRFKTPGLGAAIQRAIVETVMAVNTGLSYQVSELKVQILPLPKVAFSVTPKIATLGEESSSLMRAIQRMEKRLRGDLATLGGKILPRGVMKGWLDIREWLIGAAILLFAVSILVEIRRQLRPEGPGRSGPTAMLILLGLGVACWIGFALVPLSLITLGGGVAVFGVTALIATGRGEARPDPVPAQGVEAHSVGARSVEAQVIEASAASS